MRKHKLIVNPWAGRGAGERVKNKVLAAAADNGLHYDVEQTEGPRHAERLARAASEDYDVIVAVGGDGTVHEVVNGLAVAADGGVTRHLGIIPIGSGDDFAFSLGLGRHNVREAVKRIAHGEPRRVDMARINDEYFANEVGCAFEARVTIESRKITAPIGPALYLIAIFRSLTRYPLPRLRVAWEGDTVERDMLLVSTANGRRAGGGFLIAPHASVDDGLLDLTFADAIGRAEIVRLLPKVMNGTHVAERPVHTARTPWVTVESDTPFPVHADGEVVYTETRRLELAVLLKMLSVLT